MRECDETWAEHAPDPVDPPTRPCFWCGEAVNGEWEYGVNDPSRKTWCWAPVVLCEDCEVAVSAAEHERIAEAQRAAGFPSLAAAHERQGLSENPTTNTHS